jgi:Cu+-exporting ATPase
MAACCESAESFLGTDETAQFGKAPQEWLRFAIALVVAGLSMQFSLGVNLSPVTGQTRLLLHGGLTAAAILVLVLLGGPILRRSWRAARERQVTLEQLFLLGIVGALGASVHSSVTGTGAIYYEVVGVLVAVYTLGQILVERQRGTVRTSLHRLTDSLRTAVLLTCCGKQRVVPVSELEAGDRVFIEKGQRLPVDGVIVEGRAYLQEISHTGEPFPAAKAPGDFVLAGTVALDGDLVVSVADGGANRELDRMAKRLESALNRRSGWLREADRWMRWFVPAIALIALGTFAFWSWRVSWDAGLFNGLAVLLVACPCGLGLGVPIALWHALHRLALLGIAADGSDLVERLARTRAVVFDKTGTLTEEVLRLNAIVVIDGVDAGSLRARLALIESHCDHPVARPFSAMRPDAPRPPEERLLGVQILPGRGVRAQVAGGSGQESEIVIGNHNLVQPVHHSALAELRGRSPETAEGNREIFVFEDGRLIALAFLAETTRPALAGVLPRLRAMGLELCVMTGDTSINEQQWSESGLTVMSGMTPSEKSTAVQRMERDGANVLFVGDGLNDAEAMGAATASLAIVGGDSTARAHAHGELAGSALHAIPDAIGVSRAARATVRSILRVSLGYNTAGVLLAASGWLHPVAAAAIMFASSLSVVALAARGAQRPETRTAVAYG